MHPQWHTRWLEIEVFAAWLKGLLRPADAATEVVLQDIVERADRDAPGALQMFYALAGRRQS